jgi:hypothetical protein
MDYVVPHRKTTVFVRKSDGRYAGMTDWGNLDTDCLYRQMEESGDYTVIELFNPVDEPPLMIHGVIIRRE